MTASDSSQGVLAPDVLLDQGAASLDPRDFMQDVVDFVNFLLGPARLVFSEIGEIPLAAYLADQYVAQVQNGGHPQYVGNVVIANVEHGILERSFALIEKVLEGCSEPGYLALFGEFKAMLAAHPEIAAKRHRDPREMPHFRELNTLDERYFDLDSERLDADRVAWLRASPHCRLLPAEQLAKEKERIVARNRLYEQRGRERQAAAEKEPMYFAPRRLCQIVGLEYQRLTAGQPTAKPGEVFWGVATSDGTRFMLLGPNFAELFDKDRKVRLARIDF